MRQIRFCVGESASDMSLKARTVLITGASRGIGRAIAMRCAEDGANVGLIARSATRPSHRGLSGTLEEVAARVEALGGTPFVMPVDVRDAAKTRSEVSKAAAKFGAIDAIVNNASAIDVDKLPPVERVDLMLGVNVRGTLSMILASHRHLRESELGHVLSISPPLGTLSMEWLLPHPPYTLSKYGMTMLTLGYADVLRANTLWPKKLVRTAATKMLEAKTGVPGHSRGGSPYRFARAVHAVLCSRRRGQSLLDSDLGPVDENGVDDIFI